LKAVLLYLLCAASLAAVACVDRSLDPSPGGPDPRDAAVFDLRSSAQDAGADLARPVDLATPGLSCADIIECFNGCDTEECYEQCYTDGSAAGRAAYEAASVCASEACALPCERDDGSCEQCLEDIISPPGTCGGRPACGDCIAEWEVCGF